MSDDGCPIPGCLARRQGEMCRRHWFKVSKPTRDALWAAYRSWREDYGDHEKFRAYRALSNDARREATS